MISFHEYESPTVYSVCPLGPFYFSPVFYVKHSAVHGEFSFALSMNLPRLLVSSTRLRFPHINLPQSPPLSPSYTILFMMFISLIVLSSVPSFFLFLEDFQLALFAYIPRPVPLPVLQFFSRTRGLLPPPDISPLRFPFPSISDYQVCFPSFSSTCRLPNLLTPSSGFFFFFPATPPPPPPYDYPSLQSPPPQTLPPAFLFLLALSSTLSCPFFLFYWSLFFRSVKVVFSPPGLSVSHFVFLPLPQPNPPFFPAFLCFPHRAC